MVETEYMTFAFGGEAVNFISLQRGKDQPFFLYLAFNAAQNPMEAPDDYLQGVVSFANKRRQAYAGMLSAIDDVIGRVLKALRDGALEEKTLPVIQMDLTATALPLAVALPSKDYNISVLGLYDLNQDLGESHDLSSAQPERVNQLQAAWARWRKGVEGDKPISKHNLKNVNNAP